jgi:hypothetical protein
MAIYFYDIPDIHVLTYNDNDKVLQNIDYYKIFLLGICTSLLFLTCCVSNYRNSLEPRYIVVNIEPVNCEIVNVPLISNKV